MPPTLNESNKVVAITLSSSEDPQQHEDQHVHAIYDQIADHFSSTRYKPWPIISNFLSSLKPGWIGLDSGTGNGKYLRLPGCAPPDPDRTSKGPLVWMVGLDRSGKLLEIARHAGSNDNEEVTREVVWGDVLDGCWRSGVFDFAISIATIHHLATHERRTSAIKRLLQSVSPTHGRVLIYVWAIEQDELSKRNIPRSSTTAENGQDVFVPWVLPSQASHINPKVRTRERKMGVTTVKGHDEGPEKRETQVFNRYYHMFAKGELRRLVCEAADELELSVGVESDTTNFKGITIVQEGWERSNYYVEIRTWQS